MNKTVIVSNISEKSIQDMKCLRAYLLGLGIDNNKYPWESQILDVIKTLEQYQVHGASEEPKERQYAAYIKGSYVSEYRYCTADEPDSLEESDWVEGQHKPIFLSIVVAENKDQAIEIAARDNDVSINAVKVIPVGE